jgi:hypothetical protein
MIERTWSVAKDSGTQHAGEHLGERVHRLQVAGSGADQVPQR